jgi:hypothetical protein
MGFAHPFACSVGLSLTLKKMLRRWSATLLKRLQYIVA